MGYYPSSVRFKTRQLDKQQHIHTELFREIHLEKQILKHMFMFQLSYHTKSLPIHHTQISLNTYIETYDK